MAHVDRYINEESFHLLVTVLKWRQNWFTIWKQKKQFDLSQTNFAGAVADRQLGQGGQVACEDTWNTTVDDQTPVRFYLFLLVNNVGFWLDDATYNPFLEIK